MFQEDEKHKYERILSLTGEYTSKDLKIAFRRASKNNHPDIARFHGIPYHIAEENMKLVNKANLYLSQLFNTPPYPNSISSDYYAEEDIDKDINGFQLFNDKVYVGAYVSFGNYITQNNKEFMPLDWYVIDIKDNHALLITDFGIDCRPYFSWSDIDDISWENSDLRKWLNTIFYDRAFSKDEKNVILNTKIINSTTNRYGIYGGNDTIDKVWLLNSKEADGLFVNNEERRAFATEFAKQRGVRCDSDDACNWWLRNPGRVSSSVSYVDNKGFIHDYDGRLCDTLDYAVRPVIFVKLKQRILNDAKLNEIRAKQKELAKKERERIQENQRKEEEKIKQREIEKHQRKLEKDKNAEVNRIPIFQSLPEIGDDICFGKYKSNNNMLDIHWKVMDIKDNKVLLLSKNCICCRLFGHSQKHFHWRNSLLRQWLNNEFLEKSFTSNERANILISNIETDNQITQDKIYIFSENDIYKYLNNNTARRAKLLMQNNNNSSENEYICWWTRDTSKDGDKFVVSVMNTGKILKMGILHNDNHVGVRPVLWIMK